MSAWDWMGSLALLPLGDVLAGPLGAALGAPEVLPAGGQLGAVLLFGGLLPRSTRRSTRQDDGDGDGPPPAVVPPPGSPAVPVLS